MLLLLCICVQFARPWVQRTSCPADMPVWQESPTVCGRHFCNAHNFTDGTLVCCHHSYFHPFNFWYLPILTDDQFPASMAISFLLPECVQPGNSQNFTSLAFFQLWHCYHHQREVPTKVQSISLIASIPDGSVLAVTDIVPCQAVQEPRNVHTFCWTLMASVPAASLPSNKGVLECHERCQTTTNLPHVTF